MPYDIIRDQKQEKTKGSNLLLCQGLAIIETNHSDTDVWCIVLLKKSIERHASGMAGVAELTDERVTAGTAADLPNG